MRIQPLYRVQKLHCRASLLIIIKGSKATDTSRLGFVESKQVDRVNSGGVPLLLNRLLVLLVIVLPANEFIRTNSLLLLLYFMYCKYACIC